VTVARRPGSVVLRGIYTRAVSLDTASLAREFDDAIDQLEAALRACPDGLWEASLWRVERSDPWIWPPDDQPEPGRTDESIQVFSAVWMAAYHCLFYLDFYLTTDVDAFETPAYVRGGVEEDPLDESGAARFPDRVYPRDVLLRYLEYGRGRAREVIPSVTEAELATRCPPGHPHAGKTFAELLRVNLAHVRQHGGQIRDFLAGQAHA
jgi:hypothetical protein